MSLFLESIEAKKIYYFASNRLNSPQPHYYVCIARTEADLLILSCCTSQFETIKRFVESRNLPTQTLVYIPAGTAAVFSLPTYVNCNETHIYTLSEFAAKYNQGLLTFKGELPEIYYEQILIGLQASPLIEEELKQRLPTP